MRHFNLLLLLLILSSCGMHIGRYQGFKLQRNNSTSILKEGEEMNCSVKTISTEKSDLESEVFVSTIEDQSMFLSGFTPVKSIESSKNEPCDKILLRDGNEIQAKVLEVGVNTVKYKKCEDQEGLLIEIIKNDIFMITYSNGSKDVFKEKVVIEEKNTPTNKSVQLPKRHGFAVASLVFGLIGLPLFAWIFGGIAKSLIRKYPESYDGKGMANAGIILGWLTVILVLIFFIL
ncbi:MAG: hypothetical protein RLZ33_2984 [Bacteroidota bacterium]